jgi:hypothetical protein
MVVSITTRRLVVATPHAVIYARNSLPASPNAVLQQKGNPSHYVLQLLIRCFYLILATVVGFINVYKAFFTATGVLPDISGTLMKTLVINLVSVREGF